MFEELLKSEVIVDLQKFLENNTNKDNDLSEYTLFMKEQILSVSGNN